MLGVSRLLVALCAGVGLSLVLTGCREEASAPSGLNVAHEVSPAPAKVGPASVLLTLTDANGQPVTGATVEVEGNMSHPGMEPIFAVAAEAGPGRYRADMEFTMAGDWILSVNAALPDGRAVRKEIDVRGVKGR
jgi:hypothetical protein